MGFYSYLDIYYFALLISLKDLIRHRKGICTSQNNWLYPPGEMINNHSKNISFMKKQEFRCVSLLKAVKNCYDR